MNLSKACKEKQAVESLEVHEVMENSRTAAWNLHTKEQNNSTEQFVLPQIPN